MSATVARANNFLSHVMSLSGNENERIVALNKLVSHCNANNLQITVGSGAQSSSTRLIEQKRELNLRVAELEEKVASLTKENIALKLKKDQPVVSQAKKSDMFPWDDRPDLEQVAFEMFFRKKKSMEEVKSYLRNAHPSANSNTTFVNQRFIQRRPSDHISAQIVVKNDDSKTTWEELWKIMTATTASRWINRTLAAGGNGNKVPAKWQTLDPNDLIPPHVRKNLRDGYHNGLV